MTRPRRVSITLPPLSDNEAYHLVETLQELLLIVDSYYFEQIQRQLDPLNEQRVTDQPGLDVDPRQQSLDFDDPLPF